MPDLGNLIVKCVKPGGDTLALYGFAFAEGQAIDLLAPATDAAIRFGDYPSAWNATHDRGFELAAKIAAGSYQIVEDREPTP